MTTESAPAVPAAGTVTSNPPKDNNNLRRSYRLQPLRALRALKRLIADPEDTAQVFVVLEALSGRALERGYRRFRETAVGQREARQLASDAPQSTLLAHLQDRQALRALPAGTLGRAYLDFVEREQISADGLVAASESERQFGDPGLQRYAERTRDMHDLWHVATRYGRDSFGEVCLLAFTYAQTGNFGIAVIALVGGYKTRQELGKGVWRAVLRGYLDGRKAGWLLAADWERLLGLSLQQVRRELNIAAPTPYQTVWAQRRRVPA